MPEKIIRRILFGLALLLAFSFPPASPTNQADQAVLEGYKALQDKDYLRAHSIFVYVVKNDPRNPSARRYLAAALTSLGRASEAIAQIEAAQAMDAKRLNDRILLGNAHLAGGDLDKAQQYFQSCLMFPAVYRAASAGLAKISETRRVNQTPAVTINAEG